MNLFDRIPRQLSDCEVEQFYGETLLYWPSLEKMIYLNEFAAIVWNICDGHRTVQQILDVLAEAYPDTSTAVRDDVLLAIETLISEGAVEIEPSLPSSP